MLHVLIAKLDTNTIKYLELEFSCFGAEANGSQRYVCNDMYTNGAKYNKTADKQTTKVFAMK